LAALLLAFSCTSPALARGTLQCVPYARSVSGIDIHGNAWTWWDQASGLYERGQRPRIGAVLAFRASAAMPFGHVAVVSQIVDERHLLLDHANWSGPGRIEHAALAEDVSEAGDWSNVRVWYARSGGLGTRTNPTYGFIYANGPVTQVNAASLARTTAEDTVPALALSDRG
jgi:surface antigen